MKTSQKLAAVIARHSKAKQNYIATLDVRQATTDAVAIEGRYFSIRRPQRRIHGTLDRQSDQNHQ